MARTIRKGCRWVFGGTAYTNLRPWHPSQVGFTPACWLLLALVVHLAVIPGISMAVLVLYMLFFLRANLLHELHLILHVLPIISMGVTLWATSRILAFDDIPGFKRIEGLMLLVGLSFAAILAIEKTRIGVFFLARFEHLVLIIVGLVVLWKFGLSLLFGSSKTSKRRSPRPASARNPHNRQPR